MLKFGNCSAAQAGYRSEQLYGGWIVGRELYLHIEGECGAQGGVNNSWLSKRARSSCRGWQGYEWRRGLLPETWECVQRPVVRWRGLGTTWLFRGMLHGRGWGSHLTGCRSKLISTVVKIHKHGIGRQLVVVPFIRVGWVLVVAVQLCID